MFNRRVRIFLLLLLVPILIVVVRLIHLQVVEAGHFQSIAEKALVRPPRFVPSVRGRILDRNGTVLARDEPSWDICMHYGALAGDRDYIQEVAAEWRRKGWLPIHSDLDRKEQARADAEAISRKIEESYALVGELTGRPLDEIMQQRQSVLNRVSALQRSLIRRRGYFVLPEETRMAHPVVRELDDQTAVRARLVLGDLSWFSIQASTRRIYSECTKAMGHVMGRLAPVTAEIRENDPYQDDSTRRYLPWETFGVAGVERLCEPILRGHRGLIEVDIDGEEMDRTQPEDGRDAILTIDAGLQNHVYEILGKTVAATPLCTGAAAVILHIPTRQVIALVSYPAFDPNKFAKEYPKLLDDTKYRPTLFRAVAAVYPPGSVAKPATLVTALALNLITPQTRFHCRGYLHKPDGRFQCWIYRKFNISHDQRGYPDGLDAEEALQESCNCYFYQVGEIIHADRLCQWFKQLWVGPPAAEGFIAGTGLIEERQGVIPTAEWLWEKQRRPMTVGDSRNFAIGQGELGVTPLQVANLMATLATGKYMWPTVVANDGRQRPAWVLPVKQEHLKTIRRGLYRVVNDPKGTAYNYARMDEITVAGKTGSAQCSRIVLNRQFVVEYPGGRREKIIAKHKNEVEDRLKETPGAKIVSSRPHQLWPDKADNNAHAWFAGYVPGDPTADPQFAVSVLVEFGESGGTRAAPVMKEVIHALIESPHHYLQAKPAVKDLKGDDLT